MNNRLFFLFFIIAAASYAQNNPSSYKTSTTKPTASAKSKTIKLPEGVMVWTIDAQRAKCEGAITMQCLLVKQPGSRSFELFYDNIQGFDYQEGFVYTVWVKQEAKTPPIPASAGIYNYTLIKVVSKKPTPGYSNTFTDNKKPLSGMTESKTKILVVNEEKAPCSGVTERNCLLIKEEGKKEFELFYQDIDGFTFEKGFRQTIIVTEKYIPNTMVKDVQPVYTLISLISKVPVKTERTETSVISPLASEGKTPLDKRWFLKKMKDSDTTSYSIVDDAVWIEFNSAETRFTGIGPCNNYFGGFKSDLISSFQASAITGTKKNCSNMSLEEMYFSLLQNANNFKIKDGKLILSMGDRLLLVFE